MNFKRVFLVVLDSLGIGGATDAARFGDEGADTLHAISGSPMFSVPMLEALGIGCIAPQSVKPTANPLAAHARLHECSAGKDTVIGHWEIAGHISNKPLPTYPNGFPSSLLAQIAEATGIEAICNRPYSGTEVLRDYGEEMMRTGKVIVYTSADSVFQVAAHEDVIPVEKLYAYCRTARELLCGEHAVGRVIARPFIGTGPDDFTRTPRRHDFALDPPGKTMPELLCEAGKEVIGVGKIGDIFNQRGITRSYPTKDNADGMQRVKKLAGTDFEGLCFINLVDFDMKYGHRRDRDGYAAALSAFDAWLTAFYPTLREDDVLILTADHGCDPCAKGTDHTRECVPLLICGSRIKPVSLGDQDCFGSIARTVCSLLGTASEELSGHDLSRALLTGCTDQALIDRAIGVMANAYAPYSDFQVGAALLGESGRIYCGCNCENAAFSATICAERAALAQAVSAGERRFAALAVVGGKSGKIEAITPPCGTCRQVLSEFCPPAFPILMQGRDGKIEEARLGDLLPLAFGAGNMHHEAE